MKLSQAIEYAESLENVSVGTRWSNKTWMVNERGFLWERPLTKSDLARYGDATPPSGELIAIATGDLDAKEAFLAMKLPGFFTIEHFNSYPALLVELRKARARDVKAVILSAHRHVNAQPPLKSKKKRPARSRGAR